MLLSLSLFFWYYYYYDYYYYYYYYVVFVALFPTLLITINYTSTDPKHYLGIGTAS